MGANHRVGTAQTLARRGRGSGATVFFWPLHKQNNSLATHILSSDSCNIFCSPPSFPQHRANEITHHHTFLHVYVINLEEGRKLGRRRRIPPETGGRHPASKSQKNLCNQI